MDVRVAIVFGAGCNDVSSECGLGVERNFVGLEVTGKPKSVLLASTEVPTFLYTIRFPLLIVMSHARSRPSVPSCRSKLFLRLPLQKRVTMSALIRNFSRPYSVCKFPKTVNELSRPRVTRSIIPCSVRFRHGSLDVSKMTVVEKIVHDNIKVCFLAS